MEPPAKFFSPTNSTGRWLLYRHSLNPTRRDTHNFKALDKHNPRICRPWRPKDEFEHFWTSQAPWAAERFLTPWSKSALLRRLEPLREFVHTLHRHQDAVLAFIGTRVANDIAEGLNRFAKNRASGFRHQNAFSDLIYRTVGDLDLPGQITPQFRTL